MPTDYEDMETAEVEPLWATIGTDLITLEEDGELVDELEPPLVGVIRQVKHDVGENDSRLYFVGTERHARPLALWGKADIDQKVDTFGLGPGDEIGITNTGETRKTAEGEMTIYEVKYAK